MTRRLSIRDARTLHLGTRYQGRFLNRWGVFDAVRGLTLLFSLIAVPARAEAVLPKSANLTKLFQAVEKIRYADKLDDIGEIFAAETRLRTAGYLVRSVASAVRREPDALEEAALLDDVVSVLVLPPGTEAVKERVVLSLEGLASALPRVAALHINHLTAQEKVSAAAADTEYAEILVLEGLLDSAAHVIGEALTVLRSVPGFGVSRARDELTEALIASVSESLTPREKALILRQRVIAARRALERGA